MKSGKKTLLLVLVLVLALFAGCSRADSGETANVANPWTESDQQGVMEATGISTWQEIVLTAQYTLRAGDEVVATGQESASESYSFVRYLVAANASQNNAIKNTIMILAEKIGNRAIAETYKHAHADDKK